MNLSKNWVKIIVIVFVLILIGGTFYWFQWRPAQIRKECGQRKNFCIVNYDDNDTYKCLILEQIRYRDCLMSNGLEE